MNTEKQKLEAAKSVVANSILHGWTIEAKINYIRQILPNHYLIKESKQKGNVVCLSGTGINDEEQWGYFMSALKQRFSDFSEVYHHICYEHTHFTVYFRSQVV
jgi:hypothetical protein